MASRSKDDVMPLATEKEFSANEQAAVTNAQNGEVEVDLVAKQIHKVLHFCDGELEECEPEESETDGKSNLEVDPKTLSWGPWILHLTATAGTKTLQAVDYVGETLTNFFGITTPKYQYEIDEYENMCAEEIEEMKRNDLEMRGWTTTVEENEPKLAENRTPSQGKCIQEINDDETIRSQPHSIQS